MSGDEAEDWLSVAAQMLDEVPAGLLAECCHYARREVTHHAKIVPTILERCAARKPDWLWSVAPPERPLLPPRTAYTPEPPRPMTQADVDAIPVHLVELGIKCGAIVRDADGNLRPNNAA